MLPLIFIPLFSKVCLHFCKLICITSLLSLPKQCHLQTLYFRVTSLDTIFQPVHHKNNNKRLNADRWCNLILILNFSIALREVLTAVTLPSYISFITFTYISGTVVFLKLFTTFFFAPRRILSLSLQTHNAVFLSFLILFYR